MQVAEGGEVAKVEAAPEGEGAGDGVGGVAQQGEHSHLGASNILIYKNRNMVKSLCIKAAKPVATFSGGM